MAALGRFLALPRAEQWRTGEAALYLLAVRFAFALLPLPRVLRLFAIQQGQSARGTGPTAASEAAAVSRAIARAARHVPFRAVCLQQAFAASLMLRRRGLAATVHLGVARGEAGDLQAHAWSRCGEMPVTGEPQARDFLPVAVFAA